MLTPTVIIYSIRHIKVNERVSLLCHKTQVQDNQRNRIMLSPTDIHYTAQALSRWNSLIVGCILDVKKQIYLAGFSNLTKVCKWQQCCGKLLDNTYSIKARNQCLLFLSSE